MTDGAVAAPPDNQSDLLTFQWPKAWKGRLNSNRGDIIEALQACTSTIYATLREKNALTAPEYTAIEAETQPMERAKRFYLILENCSAEDVLLFIAIFESYRATRILANELKTAHKEAARDTRAATTRRNQARASEDL